MKNVQTKLIAFCDYASISRENKLSVMGIFDEVRVTQLPGGIARAFFVAVLAGEPDASYQLTVTGSIGKKIIFHPLQLNIQMSTNGQSNIVLDLVNIGFPEEGTYDFVIEQNKKQVGSTNVKVIHLKQTQEVKYTLPN